ncbi:MAG: hypothetical protein OXG05_03160 [Gammaproteobacteria bacterium]|nr:hypothetical protein [Gammaproteobacteria bacterium]
MLNYDSGTAIHFIAFAVLFTTAFAFVTWRIVRNLEKEDEASTREQAETPEAEDPESDQDSHTS